MSKTDSQTASIVCVGNRWFPIASGGAERYIYELIHYLVGSGDLVELCATDLPASEAHSSPLLTKLASAEQVLLQRLWSCYFQFQERGFTIPDAINIHFALYGLAALPHLPKDIPITFTFHGPWALESQQEGEKKFSIFFKQQIENRVYQRCDRFIVLSKAFGNILHKHYRIPWDKIHIIPGGVNTTHFQPNLSRDQARTQLGWPTDRPILFTPRRLVQRMGVDKLLDAMTQVKRQFPEVWLAIAGKGLQRDTLERQAQALDLQQHVKFLGFLPDEQLPIAYQAADLTVVPSQSLEGFGLILVESLACGTPALCTPIGGMPEILRPFSPELITETHHADAIAQRIIDLLNGAIALPSRQACRDYSCTRFDWNIIAPQVRQVLLR
ncbi:glycosyltransferase family 4 protein [Thermocoleostomius sinensis]|nr:glycosyltransferase family 4 protein [Thermocoleostomius sinensis]